MERYFYTDSFEKLLRERSDEFKMYPTKRTWKSIYNNIYPGRRWPSALAAITILSVFTLAGYVNSRNIKVAGSLAIQKKSGNTGIFKSLALFDNRNSSTTLASYRFTFNDHKPNSFNDLSASVSSVIRKDALNKTSFANDIVPIQQHTIPVNQIPISAANKNNLQDNVAITAIIQNTTIKNWSLIKNITPDNYVMNNEPLAKKWTDKLAWQVYASPYVAYGEAGSGIKIAPQEGQNTNNNFNQTTSLGLEAGTSMQYPVSKLIKVKAGLQFNYASYNMEALQGNSNDESFTTTLPKTSVIAGDNEILPVTLHNETYQFSLPVGLEFKLLQNNNLQWNAGATIQPTFIAGGNAYLLSADNRNYTDESSYINRWNLNAGFETFITYKINGLTWQFGPQVRYQFSSIYGKRYTAIDEKLANFGIKIGVSKSLH